MTGEPIDPRLVNTSKDQLTVPEASAFCTKLGFGLTIRGIQGAIHKGFLKVLPGGNSRIERSSIINLLEDHKRTQALPRFQKVAGVPGNEITARAAWKKYRIPLTEIVAALDSELIKYTLNERGVAHFTDEEFISAFPEAGGKTVVGKALEAAHKKAAETAPTVTPTPAAPTKAPETVTPPSSEKKDEPVVTLESSAMQPVEPAQFPVPKVATEEPTSEPSLIPLKEAAKYLQVYGYDITDYQLDWRGLRAKKKVFEVVRRGRKIMVDLAYLDSLIKNPPQWLTKIKSKFEAPDGYYLTRELVVKHQFEAHRLNELIAAGILVVESYNIAEGKGQIYTVSQKDYDEILQNEELCRFLKGEDVEIEAVIASRVRHAERVNTGDDAHGETETETDEGDLDQPTPPIEIEEDLPPSDKTSPQTNLTIEDVLLAVHHSRQLVVAYETAVNDGFSDAEITGLMSTYLE